MGSRNHCDSGRIRVFYVVCLLTLCTVAAAAFVLAPNMARGAIVFDIEPDPPAPFGYRMAWLAIRSRDTKAVIESLGLIEPELANWRTGLGAVYDDDLGETRVYVSPPVNGWTLVAGLALPSPMGRRFVDVATPFLTELSERFVEVQYFCSYPDLDFFAWARFIDGRMMRAFAINDEGVVWNKGRPTKEEKAMGLKLFELRGVKGRKGDAGGEILLYPTESHMMHLAGKWSLNPTALSVAAAKPATGIIGHAPAVWRSARILKAA